MSNGRRRSPLLRYLNLVVLVFALSAATVLGLTLYSYEWESSARADLDRYHVRTLTLATEVSSRIGVAREIVSVTSPEGDTVLSTAEREFVSTILAVNAGVEEIVVLQEARGEAAFVSTVERAAQRANAMESAALARSWTATRWQSELVALDLTTFQLSRLHSTTIEDELAALSQRSDRLRTAVFAFAAIVLVTCGALVVRVRRLVRARLQELDDANTALLEAQEQLQQRRRLDALATLVGGVAHDFNNVLLTILGHTELAMINLDESDPAFGSLRTIQSAGERAAALTKQLLTFSRQEAGEPQPTDLNLVIRDLEPVIRGLVPGDVDVTIVYGDSNQRALVDPVQMEQVVLNVIVNARDAMPSGGLLSIGIEHVEHVAVGDREEAGSFTRLRIEDTGSGMSPAVRARVYEPFFTTKEDGLGTGLGLSVVHGIVTDCGGVIDLTSEPDAGTRFDIYLPTIAADAVGLDEPAADPAAGGSETVMLVEDDDRIRELMTTALRNAGYEVVVAAHGGEALEMFGRRQDEISLVISDVVMPGLRGPDLIQRLRQLRADLSVVYISGYGSQEVLDSVRASGDPLVYKPFRLRELMDVIRGELDRNPEGPRQGSR